MLQGYGCKVQGYLFDVGFRASFFRSPFLAEILKECRLS